MFGAGKAVKAPSGGGGGATPTPGSAVALAGQTVSVVIPPNVTTISAICLGGGGGGGRGSNTTSRGSGGGGGAMCWSNNIAVTPGETLTLVSGAAGAAGNTTNGSGQPAGDSTVSRGGTVLVRAKGGSGGGNDLGAAGAGGLASACVYNAGANNGGTGGQGTGSRAGGGGGAGGYGGAGGTGGGGSTTTAQYGGAGGGDGAGGGATAFISTSGGGYVGGGSNMYGTGGSTGAQILNNPFHGEPGGRKGSGTNTQDIQNYLYGGGGGGSVGGTAASAGQYGFARIIWGTGVSAPSTLVDAYDWTFVTSVTSTTSTITMPAAASFRPGDIAILIEGATGSTLPGDVNPTGFDSTTHYTSSVGTSRTSISQKVMLSTDANATITGLNGSTKNRKTLLIFRQAQGCSIGATGLSAITSTAAGNITTAGAFATTPQTNQHLNGRFLQIAMGYTSGATALSAASLTFAPAGATTTAYLHPSNDMIIKIAITPVLTLVAQSDATFAGQAANNIVMIQSTLGR